MEDIKIIKKDLAKEKITNNYAVIKEIRNTDKVSVQVQQDPLTRNLYYAICIKDAKETDKRTIEELIKIEQIYYHHHILKMVNHYFDKGWNLMLEYYEGIINLLIS